MAESVAVQEHGQTSVVEPEETTANFSWTPVYPERESVVALLSSEQKQYLDKTLLERIPLFRDPEFRTNLVKNAGSKPLPVDFRWEVEAEGSDTEEFFVLEVANETALLGVSWQKAMTADVKGRRELRVWNLEIGRLWRWRIGARSDDSATWAVFRTEDHAPRLLNLGGIPNARDIGGRVGRDGRLVRQGMILRSAGMNENATPRENPDTPGATRVDDIARAALLGAADPAEILADGSAFFPLQLQSDLDVRGNSECFGMTGSPLGDAVQWLHYPVSLYQWLISGDGAESFRTVFPVFLDPKNYPLDIHCIEGQDRTGSVCFILEGLLGVKEEEMWRDWEATGFHNPHWGFRHESRMNPFIRAFSEFPGETLHEKIESYVLSLGVTEDQIHTLRELLLEPPRNALEIKGGAIR